jgi:hypothetical protein
MSVPMAKASKVTGRTPVDRLYVEAWQHVKRRSTNRPRA